MAKINAFTLLEVLFVLAIVSILLLLSVPITFSAIEKQEEKYFFDTFQSDVLYLQNLSLGSDLHYRIYIRKDHYQIRKGTETLVTRNLPEGWTADRRTVNHISFNKHGTIQYPGTITVKTEKNSYNIIFPLGKGRGYIEKQ